MHAALKNTVRWLAPVLAGATFVAANLAAPATAQTTFKMAYALSQQSHYGAAGEAFAKTLEEGSGGRLKVQQFPNSALGGEREVIEGLQLGTIDLAVLSTGATMNFVPAAGVFDVPFLLRDLDHARHVLDSEIGQDMLKEFGKRGLVALAWGEQGFRHLTNNVRPVVTPADAKGLKIRTTENQLHIAAFRQIGILPTPMAWPEVTTALQQGTIDGQENPLSVITSAKLSQVQKYLSLTGHVYAPAVIIASPSAYERLSAEDKALMQQAGKNAGQAMRDFVSHVEQAGVEQLKAEGMAVNTVDREAFAQAVEPVYKEYNRRFDPKLIERIRNTQ
ncbi:DctP family TRAP transporter solute-binding subunit [Corticibacter populi]|uniref:DctP family TRAP transporter solute-binding subunit n=1 Tax=Corticibacter populi TaxID=1550736 RepID=A0A3M6R0W9_9BURK|nr:TRAP transporter substrate-binding protein [Corticibacter populi]RMX08823.1 DctP family TRAP transporter solute-binding subunit [Corticibacter populi]RZS35013.1 tripartite ATP-independent transporter DctP family solute receptor [Corticibacter populi]